MLKKGGWTADEDAVILRLHASLGTRWAEIAKSLPGRSDNSVKNRWYSTCSRLLKQQQQQQGEGGGSTKSAVKPVAKPTATPAAAATLQLAATRTEECFSPLPRRPRTPAAVEVGASFRYDANNTPSPKRIRQPEESGTPLKPTAVTSVSRWKASSGATWPIETIEKDLTVALPTEPQAV